MAIIGTPYSSPISPYNQPSTGYSPRAQGDPRVDENAVNEIAARIRAAQDEFELYKEAQTNILAQKQQEIQLKRAQFESMKETPIMARGMDVYRNPYQPPPGTMHSTYNGMPQIPMRSN